ncbi:DUF2637 domain-containing protein, partial [Streptomyces sp. UNOB3_S3]|uniref:DUF2637 domain-containing protein n=1 Tax=Streptomyces sp. UNOB3_S3 TaxID=2871682 RepID=UPI001E5EBD00
MTRPTTAPLTATTVGASDRTAIVALGTAGCALSYDALQQMAVAIHVRGFLTYLFPLVIDGFIAYGVRALILTRTAPWHARAYVWMLFGTATAASIWANALHAVRLNQQVAHHGLRLGDTVVAILSTIAPLALAGAVHLYILITRHHPQPAPAAEAAAGLLGDGDRSVPEQAVDEDDGPRRLRLVPEMAAGPDTGLPTAGDRPAGEDAGSRSGTALPIATGDRDRPAVPSVHGDGAAPRHHPADGDGSAARHHPADRGRGSDAVPDSAGDGAPVPGADRDLNASIPNALRSERAGGVGSRRGMNDASDAGTGPTVGEDGASAGPEMGDATGDRTETGLVPGFGPTGDRAEPVPGTGCIGPGPVTGLGNGEGGGSVPGT